ncbi:MAG: amidase family protein, partial [Chloroflexota bacterium]|nr:amidase family protein [Chloroflexota bacterium]
LQSGESARLTAPEDRSGAYHALEIPAVDYLKALRVRTAGGAAMASALAGFDAILAPAYPCIAPPAEGNFEAYFDQFGDEGLGGMGNLIGLPSIAVPTGFENGSPTSLEILGPWWTEGTLVAIAEAYQARTDWHTRRPDRFA